MRNIEIQNVINAIPLKEYIVQTSGSSLKAIGNDNFQVNPCPICGKKDHFTIYTKTNSYSSFSGCCKGGSLIDYLIEAEGYSQKEAVLKIHDMTGYKNVSVIHKQKKSSKSSKPSKKYDFNHIIEKAHRNVESTNYFESRGLTHTVEKYKLGYSPRGYNHLLAQHPELNIKIQNQAAYRFTLPIFDEHGQCVYFITRRDDSLSLDNAKTLNLKGQPIRLFNERYITDPSDDNHIFIVEGIFDALSLEEIGYKAIALNSVANTKRFIEIVKHNLSKLNNFTFLIVGDNDVAGQNMNSELAKSFSEMKLDFDVIEVHEQYKDLNDHLENNRPGFESYIRNLINHLEGEDRVSDFLLSFEEKVVKLATREPISTGFNKLDAVLGGGLFPSLITLGATSSLGKTTFAQQIADNVANKYIGGGEKDVLFFSLEMSKTELVAKSISRTMLCIDPRNVKTHSQILQGQSNATLNEAIRSYYDSTAKSLRIIEGSFGTNVIEIRNRIQKHIKRTGNRPVVIVDYLQALRPLDSRLSDKKATDQNVIDLKHISRDFNIPVIAISSFNRASYQSPVSFESFKESGGIEYTADVVIGLQLECVRTMSSTKYEDRIERINAKKSQPTRDIELVVLKNRNDVAFANLPFYYTPAYNTFTQKILQN